MTRRFIDDQCWLDAFLAQQKPYGKLLYVYLFIYPKSQAHGIIKATPEDLSYYTKIPLNNIITLLEAFDTAGKVKWIRHKDKIWVKEYILIQPFNPTCFTRLKMLLCSETPALIEEYINYYNDIGFWKAHHINMRELKAIQNITHRRKAGRH